MACIVLAATLTHLVAVQPALSQPAAWAEAIAVWTLVQPALIALVTVASGRGAAAQRMFMSKAGWVTAVISVALGLAVAAAVSWHLWAPVAMVPVIVLAQWFSTKQQVRANDAVDPITGCVRERAWRQLADQADPHLSVLAVELDIHASQADVLACAALLRAVGAHNLGRSETGFLTLVAPNEAEATAATLARALARAGVNARCGVGEGATRHDQVMGALQRIMAASAD